MQVAGTALRQKMNTKEAEGIIRHVSVALDASAQSGQTIAIAVELAIMLEASLEGVFVEDINLIRIAELPFTRVVGAHSKTADNINIKEMERLLRSSARKERLKLEEIARERGIPCSFRVRRGSIKTELMNSLSESDALMVNASRQMQQHHIRRTRDATRLLSKTVSATESPVSILFTGMEGDKRTLLTAASLASRLGRPLNVIINGEISQKDEHRSMAATLLEKFGQGISYITVTDSVLNSLVDTISQSHSAILLVNAAVLNIRGDLNWASLEMLPCPVLLIRDRVSTE
jgi:nucleotide-binding universal stress UspA family protein